jgi:hypothetical protein
MESNWKNDMVDKLLMHKQNSIQKLNINSAGSEMQLLSFYWSFVHNFLCCKQ